MQPFPASAPAHQHSFNLPPTPTDTASTSSSPRSSGSRRAPRLRVYTRSSLSSSSSVIAESDEDTLSLQSASSAISDSDNELPSATSTGPPSSVSSSRFSSYGSVEEMGVEISTSEEEEANQRSASDDSEDSEEGDEQIAEEPLTPKAFNRPHSYSLPTPPATAGLLGSQTTFLRSRLSDAVERRLAGAKGIGMGLPGVPVTGTMQLKPSQPRSPIVLAGGAINPKRDEKKALGLKAAVGSFKRRTASASGDPCSPSTPQSAGFGAQQQASPSRSNSFPSGLPSPGFSPLSPAFAPLFPGSTALSSPVSAAPAAQYTSYLEQRRQSLMNRAGAGGHRRIVSEAPLRSPGLDAKYKPLASPLPSLDQIRDWAASRKSSVSAREQGDDEILGPRQQSQRSPSSDGSGPETTILAAGGSISDNLPQSAHVTSQTPSSNPGVYRPPHLASKPTVTPSPANLCVSTTPITLLTPKGSGVRINIQPASALQQGQDALAFAKALLASPSPAAALKTPGTPGSRKEGTEEERVERRKALLGGLKKAGERRGASMGMPAGGAVVAPL